MIDAHSTFSLACVDEADMTPELDAAIRELLCECFGPDAWSFQHTRAWHGSAPEYSIVRYEDGRAWGHVGVHVREIACDGARVKIAGVQNVAVHPDRRRTGLSRRVMHEAMDEAARRGLPYGVLFCVPKLEHFYHWLGWERVDAAVTMIDGTGAEVPGDPRNIVMVKHLNAPPLRPRAIHLLGWDW